MSSRQEQKEARRQERLAQEQAAAQGERRRKLVGYGVGAVLAVAAIVALGAVAFGGESGGAGPLPGTPEQWPSGSVPPRRVTDLRQAARTAGCKVESHRSEGNNHVSTPVTYRANPPHSGDHSSESAEDGAYLTLPVPREQFVHELEHGRIHIQYGRNAPDALKGRLKALYDEDPYHMVLSPAITPMPYEVAATAWTETLTCPRADEGVFDAIRAFKDVHRDKGPEFIP